MTIKYISKETIVKMFNSKKAGLTEIVTSPIFVTLLIVGGFMVLLMYKLSNTFSSEYYNSIFLTMDMALALNSLYSVNGNIVLEYPNDLSNLTFDFARGGVFVYTSDKDIPAYAYSLLNKEYTTFFPEKLEKYEGKVYFSKVNKEVRITKDKPNMDFPIKCPEKKDYEYKKILIQSDLDEVIKAIEGLSVFEKDITLSKTILPDSDLIIIIKKDDNKKKSVTVRYPENQDIGPYLACSLTRKIASVLSDQLEGSNYLPSQDQKTMALTINLGGHFFEEITLLKIKEAINEFLSQ